MRERVKVACVQAEPVVLDREATLEKLAALTAEAAGAGAQLVVFPETFVPVYPSSLWARAFAGWADERAKEVFARICANAVEVPGPAADRLGAIAREHGVWLVTGVNELERGTLYNSLLYHAPDGSLALHHRKLVPTNHERLIWGQGDGRGLRAVETPLGRLGGLICWENYMPLARFALYESGLELYVASTADDGDAWQATLVHLARESRAFVIAPCHYQRGSSYPADFELTEELAGGDLLGRGGSAILAPDGSYLAGPLPQAQVRVADELERQVQSLAALAVLLRGLGREAEHAGARRLDLRVQVAEAARLRCATPGAGDRVPLRGHLLAWFAHAREEV